MKRILAVAIAATIADASFPAHVRAQSLVEPGGAVLPVKLNAAFPLGTPLFDKTVQQLDGTAPLFPAKPTVLAEPNQGFVSQTPNSLDASDLLPARRSSSIAEPSVHARTAIRAVAPARAKTTVTELESTDHPLGVVAEPGGLPSLERLDGRRQYPVRGQAEALAELQTAAVGAAQSLFDGSAQAEPEEIVLVGPELSHPPFIEVGTPIHAAVRQGAELLQIEGRFILFEGSRYHLLVDGEDRVYSSAPGGPGAESIIERLSVSPTSLPRSVPSAVMRDFLAVRTALASKPGTLQRQEGRQALLAHVGAIGGKVLPLSASGGSAAGGAADGEQVLSVAPEGDSWLGKISGIVSKKNGVMRIDFSQRDLGDVTPPGSAPPRVLSLNPLSVFGAAYPRLHPDAIATAWHELKHLSRPGDDLVNVFSDRLLAAGSRYGGIFWRSEMSAWQITVAAMLKEFFAADRSEDPAWMHRVRHAGISALSVLIELAQQIELIYSRAYEESADGRLHANASGGTLDLVGNGYSVSLRGEGPFSVEELQAHLLQTVRRARVVGVRGELKQALLRQQAPRILWEMLRHATPGRLSVLLKDASLEDESFMGIPPTSIMGLRLLAEIFHCDDRDPQGPLALAQGGTIDYFSRLTGRGVRIDRSTGRIQKFISLPESERKNMRKDALLGYVHGKPLHIADYDRVARTRIERILFTYDSSEAFRKLIVSIPGDRLRAVLAGSIAREEAFQPIIPSESHALALLEHIFRNAHPVHDDGLTCAVRIEHADGVEYRNRMTGVGVLLTPGMDDIVAFVWRRPVAPVHDLRRTRWHMQPESLRIPD
ncbi:MAG: hypothetical protein WCU88_00245 [Elusimicrobiota bacterium]|jgi:hypothetical protein